MAKKVDGETAARASVRGLTLLGVWLIAAGAVSVALMGARAKSGFFSGAGVGALSLLWAWLMARGAAWALPVAIGNIGFGALAFGWRAFISWLALADGKHDRLKPAVLTTLMCAACAAVLPMLLRQWREEEAAAGR